MTSGRFMPPSFNPISPALETTTVWSFPERGSWSTHRGDYPGNWSPHIPRNLILRYTKPGDLVLDCFVGSGTTLIEAHRLGRVSIGVDINPGAISLSQARLPRGPGPSITLRRGDARDMSFIKECTIDLACVHPPYANIIRYSDESGDLSGLEPAPFLEALHAVALELFRVVKADGHCCVLMGDTRKRRHVQPLGFWTLDTFIRAGFVIREIVIKKQHNCRSTPYWENRSRTLNFLLLAHEYLFIFRRPRGADRGATNSSGLFSRL